MIFVRMSPPNGRSQSSAKLFVIVSATPSSFTVPGRTASLIRKNDPFNPPGSRPAKWSIRTWIGLDYSVSSPFANASGGRSFPVIALN